MLELLLVMTSITIIAGFSIPLWRNQIIRNDLDVAMVAIAQNLRRAQLLSRAVDGDIGWGVKVQSGSITMFQGSTYATRNSDFDEVFSMPSTVTPSGISEIDFNKFSGLPASTGTFTLTTEQDSRSLTINIKGMIVD